MNHLKLFDDHTEYETFVSGDTMIRPNVSYCVDENHVHYDRYFLTPKQFVEYRYSFLKSLCDKFYTYRKQHMDFEFKSEYEDLCMRKMGREMDKLKLYDKGLRYTTDGISTYSYTYASFRNGDNDIIYLDVSNLLQIHARLEGDNNYVIFRGLLHKTDETYNGNDVFFIYYAEIEESSYDEDDFEKANELSDEVLYGDNIVLLCPHNTYANFTIAYPDGNGGYTTTKPSSLTWTLTITNGTITPNPEWISLILFHMEDESINTRVENVVTAMRTDFRKWYNADFNDLSVLDDIKLEFPKDIYDFIVNPWKYLDEDTIFNGQWN